MEAPLLLFGAGGHAAVIADLVQASGSWTAAGAVDPMRTPSESELLGVRVGGLDDFPHEWPLVVAVGDNATRARIVADLTSLGRRFAAALVHPAAVVSPHAELGCGTVVMAGAVVNPRAVVGAHVIVNTNACVEHDCRIGDFAHISPGAVLAGGVSVGDRSHVGTGACVIPGRRVGADSVVGAGGVVIRDVPDRSVSVGNPARVIRSR